MRVARRSGETGKSGYLVKTFGRRVDLSSERHIVERLASERVAQYLSSLVGGDCEFLLNFGHGVARANGVGGSEIDISRHGEDNNGENRRPDVAVASAMLGRRFIDLGIGIVLRRGSHYLGQCRRGSGIFSLVVVEIPAQRIVAGRIGGGKCYFRSGYDKRFAALRAELRTHRCRVATSGASDALRYLSAAVVAEFRVDGNLVAAIRTLPNTHPLLCLVKQSFFAGFPAFRGQNY